MKRSVVALFILTLTLFIFCSLPLPIQRPFEASLLMEEISFTYPPKESDGLKLLGGINNIACIRLDGVKSWIVDGLITQSSNPNFIKRSSLKFELLEPDSRLYLGSCKEFEAPNKKLSNQLGVRSIRIPAGTIIDYLSYSSNPNNYSLQLGLIIPKNKEGIVQISFGSRTIETVLQNANLPKQPLLQRVDLTVNNIKNISTLARLSSSSPQDVASIKLTFPKNLKSDFDWFPKEIAVNYFKIQKCEPGETPKDNKCRSRIKSGKIQVSGTEFASFSNDLKENTLDSNADIKIQGEGIKNLKNMQIENGAIRGYLTGKTTFLKVGTKELKAISIFDILPERFTTIIVAALVSFICSLLIWLIQKWVE